jgi:hypothetical protein
VRALALALSWMSVMLVLAGCSGDPDAPSPGPDPATPSSNMTASQALSTSSTTPASSNGSTPTEIPWEILGCRFAYAQPAANAAAVAAMLPEGFPLAQPIGPRVLVGFEVNECASGTGLDGVVMPQTYVSFWVGVQPPSGMGEEGAAHFVNFDVLVQDQPRRDLLRSWGTPAHDGSVTWSAPADGAIRIDYELEEVGTFAISAAGASPRTGMPGTFDQWTPGTGGLTYWRTDFEATQLFQGTGILEVDPASPYASWFEAPSVPAVVNFGQWDYTSGFIRRPGAPA